MNKINSKVDKINQLRQANKLRPYIEHIRFPHFKNIHKNTKIRFDFPFTVLVGKNGCGKSSVLHALYGAPEGKSVGDFWFSTHIDPIKEDSSGRNRMIYGFHSTDAKRDVEVIKMRIQYTKKNGTTNPDYWEPSRPKKNDGMEDMPPLPEGIDGLIGRSKTRWNAIDKNVVYINFRSELSAFDKYFNFHDLSNIHQNKQNYLRNWSTRLKDAIVHNLGSSLYYGKERIRDNRKFTEEELSSISHILDKDYKNGRYIEHSFFKSQGYSVIFTTEKIEYSEAFAGSGESIIARLVVKVLNAPEHSLILLDEPEVSLHPSAQKNLREFLLDQIIKKKHQIIIATHSSIFVDGMPKEAVKLFYPNPEDGKFEVQNETHPSEAFHHLGSILHTKKTIIVEDKLAKTIVERALRLIGNIYQDYNVEYYPGGAPVLIGKYIPYHSIRNDKNVWFILDGDQKCIDHIDPDTIPACDNNQLDKLIKEQTGIDIALYQDSNKPEQKIKLQREFLKFYKNRVFYLPTETPEKFIWDNVPDLTNQDNEPSCYKEAFEKYAQNNFDDENVNSDQIFHIQHSMLVKVQKECDDMSRLINTLNNIINNSSN